MSLSTPFRPGPSRRSFLASLGAGALAWPGELAALDRRLAGGADGSRGDGPSAADVGEAFPGARDFWDDVRGEFLIPEGRIYLNNGTLGPQPRIVVEAVEEHGRRVARTLPPTLAWDEVKAALSRALGGDAPGFVVPRNTTEAVNLVAAGLELSPGDEVVTTDHEHIGGLCAWEMLAARRDVRLRVATLPRDFAVFEGDPEALDDAVVEAVWQAVGPRTRVLSLSHVLFTNGALLPVARLAARCRDAGITFVVDGAHPPGLMPVDLAGIGADFYASSPHKWLLASQGTGLLWMAPRWRSRLWPLVASGDWEEPDPQRFNHVGTMDESRVAGLVAALAFLETVGIHRIEERVAGLQARLREGLGAIPGLRFRSPGPERTRGMLSFTVDGVDALALQGWLARTERIRTRVIGEYGLGWMRLSTHYYNRPSELDRVVELVDRAARRGIPGAP